MPGRPVEVVNLRLQAVGGVEKPALEREPAMPNDGSDAALGKARYDRERLRPGASFAGPALVFQLDSTVYVPASWSARVDGYRNLILERQP
jgi:N-methylhydantoinase A